MTTPIIFLLIALVVLVLNAFFVFAEFSLVRVRNSRLKELSQKGDIKANRALYASTHIDKYLSAIQLGSTMTSLGLGWVGQPSIGKLLEIAFPSIIPSMSTSVVTAISFVIAFSIVTALHVVLGEQVPKLLSIRYPDRIAMVISYPLHIFYQVTFIFHKVLSKCVFATLRLLGIDPDIKKDSHSEDELRIILQESQKTGEVSLRRFLMFENLFDFDDILASEIMTPLSKIVALKKSDKWSKHFETIKQKKFSRYPIYDKKIEDCKKYVLIKKVSIEFLGIDANPPIEKYTYPMLSVKADDKIEDILRKFQSERVHQALVKDEKNNVLGLLTLEDILEELVGEISDESESSTPLELHEIFIKKACIMEMSSKGKMQAFNTLIDKLYKIKPMFNKDYVKKSISKKEEVLSCVFGKGIAFPHARINIEKPLICAGVLKKQINCIQTNLPIKIIFLIITPLKEPTMQLQILSKLSKLMSNDTVKNRLMKCKNVDDFVDTIIDFEDTIAL